MTKKRNFGELELAILALFAQRETWTVKEAQQALGGRDKYTTVMTVMARLVEKKELKREKIGLQYLYTRLKAAAPMSLLERFKQKIFQGKTAPMISYLLESGDLTNEELAEVEKLIKARKK